MRNSRILAGFLAALTTAPASQAETLPHQTVCDAIASSLPPRGTRLSAKPINEVIAAFPGSVLSLQPATVQGLTLESTYAGSLNCQLPKLYKNTGGVHEEIAIPARFQGGEGALCADDKVQLVAVNHTPALLETALNGRDNRLDLDIAVESSSDWSPPCRLSIETTPRFGITGRLCDGAECKALEKVAVEAADSRHTGDYATHPPKANELSPEKQERWTIMKQLANERKLIKDDLPTFGQEKYVGRLHSFVDWKTVLTPVEIGSDLLLGKIGTAGFGSHYGSDELFAAYRLIGDKFQPVAGFYLSVVARSLDGYQVNNTP